MPTVEIPIDNRLGDAEIEDVPPFSIQSPPLTPFCHNPLHDLESLWWVTAYFVMKKVPHVPRTAPHNAGKKWTAHAQRASAAELFSCNSTRYTVMQRRDDFRGRMDMGHPSVRAIVYILSDLRDMLASRYAKAAENAAAIDHTCADGLHKHFIRAFTMISQAKKLQGIELFPFDHESKGLESEPGEGGATWLRPSLLQSALETTLIPRNGCCTL